MTKLLLAIVVLSILAIVTVSCQQEPLSPKMTAPEVCQYVNQALPDIYTYYGPLRYRFCFTALSAQHIHQGVWEVSVRVVAEPERFFEGRWIATPLWETKTYIERYYFFETTGALAKIK